MNINNVVKDYQFTITPEHLEPALNEPVVQAFLSLLSHCAAALMMFKQFLELCRMLHLGDFVIKLIRLYMPVV